MMNLELASRIADHRYRVGGAVGDVDLAAVGGHRHAEGLEADGDRGADRAQPIA